jgi:hypothetical protein
MPRIKRFALAALAALSALGCQGAGSDSDADFGPRHVVTERWDTVFVAGGDHVNDTLFAGPHKIVLLGSMVIVADGMMERVIALDQGSGSVQWTFGRMGEGPREFRGIADLAVTRDGRLWVLDFGNGRIASLSPDGTFHGVRTFHHLPAPPTAILLLDDRAIAMSHGLQEPFMEIGLDSFELRESFGLGWPDPVPALANMRVTLAEGPAGTWVSAFALGPGFTVWDRGEPRSYRYREPIPFAIRPSAELTRMRADSARNGAVSMTVLDDEIFILFGGRPVRAAHPGEPTRWIDVYSVNGRYQRSYRLPFDTRGMATDGRTFYLLVSDGIPRVIALRPIVE